MENFYNLKILKDKNNFVIFLISNIFFITLLYFSNGYHLVGPIFLYIKFPYNFNLYFNDINKLNFIFFINLLD